MSDFSEAILKIFEDGELEKLETAMRANYTCSGVGVDATDVDRLSPGNFWGLFLLTVGMSTIALVLYGLCFHKNELECQGKSREEGKNNAVELASGVGDDKQSNKIQPIGM